MNETNKIRLYSIFIILGATIACVAPFIHVFFPVKSDAILILEEQFKTENISAIHFETTLKILKEEQKIFGFNSMHSFLLAIGSYITTFIFSILIMLSASYINQYNIKRAITISSLLLFAISCYFIIWIFFPRNDLPKITYYVAITIGTIVSTFLAYHLIVNQNKTQRYLGVIRKLTTFVIVDIREKYIQIEDKKAYTKDITNLTDKF